MAIQFCAPCRSRRNLVDRNRRAGRASNLTYSPCKPCRAKVAAERRVNRPSQAKGVDEAMVYRLLGGQRDSKANRMERAEAIRQLLAMKPRMTYGQIAIRVGVHKKTVERWAMRARSTV